MTTSAFAEKNSISFLNGTEEKLAATIEVGEPVCSEEAVLDEPEVHIEVINEPIIKDSGNNDTGLSFPLSDERQIEDWKPAFPTRASLLDLTLSLIHI